MKKPLFILVFMILLSNYSFAAEVCKTIDVSLYSQEQKNFLYASVYDLIFKAGDNRVPSSVDTSTGEVCFQDPAVNLNSVFTQNNVTNNINALIADASPTPEKINSIQREHAKEALSSVEGDGKLLRAIADIIKDEINLLRQWTASFKGEVASASNLADLKTRVATLPNLSDRTLSQLKTEIQNRIDSGQVDS